MSYEGPVPQRRLTVAFRLLLALPHFLYAALVGLAAFFAVLVGWFAALALGRLPRGIADFVTRVVQYVARVNAYARFLLTDRYPPFELGGLEYPVTVDIPHDVRLNRAAVLFRFVLMIPAAIVVQLLSVGLYLLMLVTWLLVLMLGRLPVSLFEALAASHRYEVRFYAYAALLTSEYPRGLFGDKGSAASLPTVAPASVEPSAGTHAPGSTDYMALGPPPTPKITRLVLSRAAKWIIGLTLALGVALGTVGNILAIASLDTETADRLEEMYAAFGEDGQRYGRAIQSCAVAGGLECVHRANRDLAGSVRAFQGDLREMDFSDAVIGKAEELDRTVTTMIGVLERMATATDPAAYEKLVTEFQTVAVEFDQKFNELHTAVLFS